MNDTVTRQSPFFDRLQALDAASIEAGGWEPTWYYESNGDLTSTYDLPDHIDQSPCVGFEHRHVREHVGMCDLSSMFPFEVSGESAPDFVQRLLTNDVDIERGDVRYALMLNDDGGILGDIIVTKLTDGRYFCMAPTGFENFDEIVKRAPDDTDVRDLQDCYATVCVWGPKAEDVVDPVVENGISTADFPYFTCQEINIGGIPAIALRLSFVGENGWEFWTPMGYGGKLWDMLWEAGQSSNVRPLGYGAAITMSLEKDYRLMNWDIGPEYNPFEARMEHVVDMETEFTGKAALENELDQGVDRRLLCLTMMDGGALPPEGSTVLDKSTSIGETIRSEYGYSVGENIVYAYLPPEYDESDRTVTIVAEGDDDGHEAIIREPPLFDPSDERMRS